MHRYLPLSCLPQLLRIYTTAPDSPAIDALSYHGPYTSAGLPGLLLNYDRGTLHVFSDADTDVPKLVGAVCDGLGGELVWFVELREPGSKATIEEVKEWPTLPDPPRKPEVRFGSKYGDVTLAEAVDRPGHGVLATCNSHEGGLAVGVSVMSAGTHYVEFAIASASDLRFGILLRDEREERPNVHASQSARGFVIDCKSGKRINDGAVRNWAGMPTSGFLAGDLIGLMLEIGSGSSPPMLTVFKNGAQLGCAWDSLPLGKKWQWIAELGCGSSVRILEPLPPRQPPTPRQLEPPEPPPKEDKQGATMAPRKLKGQAKRVQRAKPGEMGKVVEDSSGAWSQVLQKGSGGGQSAWTAEAHGTATTMTETLDIANTPTKAEMVASLFRHFDVDGDKFLNYDELSALEYEVDNEEMSSAIYEQLCSAVDADKRKGLDVLALTRFYELGAAQGELERAYESVFCQPTDALTPLATWKIRDSRSIGGRECCLCHPCLGGAMQAHCTLSLTHLLVAPACGGGSERPVSNA